MPYLDVMSLLVSKTNTDDSSNFVYLQISDSIFVSQIRDTGLTVSVFHKQRVHFLWCTIFIKKLLRQILSYTEKNTYRNKNYFKQLYFTIFTVYNIIGFYKSIEIEFEFALRMPCFR